MAALITGGLSAVVSVIATLVTNSKTAALVGYRLDQLEKKQDKHNAVIERVYHLEKEQTVTEEKIRVANHRIDDLENHPSFAIRPLNIQEERNGRL